MMKVPKLFVYKKNVKTSRDKAYDGRLSGLVQKEFRDVDNETEIKKKEIGYTAMLAEEYWPVLIKIVDQQKKDRSLENLKNLDLQKNDKPLENMIFDETRNALKKLEAYAFPFGITMYHGNPEDSKDTPLLLGWAKLEGISNSYDAYAFKPTDIGMEIINRLRKIRGQPPVNYLHQNFVLE